MRIISNFGNRQKRKGGRQDGFTLFEFLVVIGITAILGAIAVVASVNPREPQRAAEAEALKTNLRFTQARAMADLPGNIWSLNLAAGSYTLLRNGAIPQPPVNLPGADSGTYRLPSGVLVTGGVGPVRFNFRGQPVDAAGAVLGANQTVTVQGAPPITITRETGFIP